MKKIFKARVVSIFGIIALVAMIVSVAACGGGESPSSVTRKAITAIEKGDQKGIEANFTEEAAAMIIPLLEKAGDSMSESGGIDSMEETIDGDTAKVKVTFKDGSTGDFDLVKVDGKWKVTLSK